MSIGQVADSSAPLILETPTLKLPFAPPQRPLRQRRLHADYAHMSVERAGHEMNEHKRCICKHPHDDMKNNFIMIAKNEEG